MKYFVFSDVHGHYSILKDELRKAGFDVNNENHMLISLGDNFDRGKENYEMFLFLKKMKELNKIILVKGNHEDLMFNMIYSKHPTNIDINNGTYGTIEEFAEVYCNNKDGFLDSYYDLYNHLKKDGFLDFITDMLDYYETDHFVFTHGFIPVDMDTTYRYCPFWRDSTGRSFEESRWTNGIYMSIYHNIGEPNKKIVVGHFHSSYGNVRKAYGMNLTNFEYRSLEYSNFDFFDIYEDNNIIAIDACTVYSKKVNVLVVED